MKGLFCSLSVRLLLVLVFVGQIALFATPSVAGQLVALSDDPKAAFEELIDSDEMDDGNGFECLWVDEAHRYAGRTRQIGFPFVFSWAWHKTIRRPVATGPPLS